MSAARRIVGMGLALLGAVHDAQSLSPLAPARARPPPKTSCAPRECANEHHAPVTVCQRWHEHVGVRFLTHLCRLSQQSPGGKASPRNARRCLRCERNGKPPTVSGNSIHTLCAVHAQLAHNGNNMDFSESPRGTGILVHRHNPRDRAAIVGSPWSNSTPTMKVLPHLPPSLSSSRTAPDAPR